MQRIYKLVLASVMVAAMLPQAAWADGGVVINQLQTGSAVSASQEFIELFNLGPTAVDLTGWRLQYKSATSANVDKSWDTRATLAGSIAAGGYYLLAPKGYLQPDAELSSGLAASGGHVRLIDFTGAVVDLVGWGTANAAEGLPAPASDAGQSLERTGGIDTGNNALDFSINPQPDPYSSAGAQTLPVDNSNNGSTAPAPVADVSIIELLVNPAPPQTDANDEFIELSNNGDQPAELQSYKLQTGSDFHDAYTLPALTIAPGAFAAIYARDSHLSLTNSGGAARLLDPSGNVVDQTPDYGTAPDGQSWAEFQDGWQWTLSPTPGLTNVLQVPPVPPASSSSGKTAATKAKSSSTVAKSSKTSSAKSASAKTAKSAKAKSSPSQPTALLTDAASSSQGRWLLIAALALTIGYVIYEFRYDVRNYYLLTKRKLDARRKNRPAA